MRWIARLLAGLFAVPASPKSWAPRALCPTGRAEFHKGVLTKGALDHMGTIAGTISDGLRRTCRITPPSGVTSPFGDTLRPDIPLILTPPQRVERKADCIRMTGLPIFHRDTCMRPAPFLADPRPDLRKLGIPLEMYDRAPFRFACLVWGYDGLSRWKARTDAEPLLRDPYDDFTDRGYPIQGGHILLPGEAFS